MFRSKNFLIENLGLGNRTREDTLIILGCLYDEIYEYGMTDQIIGKYLYIKEYLNNHRELLKLKATYTILSLGTFLDRSNLILELSGKDILTNEDKENYEQKIINHKISLIEFDFLDFLKKQNEQNENKKIKENKKLEDCTGVYGIYVNDKLVYIGRTLSSFKNRFKSHKSNLNNSDEFMYKKLKEYKEAGKIITLKPLIAVELLNVEHKKTFTKNDINCMELALITMHKPFFNIEGRIKSYVFR